MLTSANNEFSDSQNLTATGASTNVIDLGAPGTVLGAPAALVRDIGKGCPIPIYVRLDVAATGTSPTLDVDVEMDTADSFGSATVVASAAQIAGGAAGDEVYLNVYLPEGITERYIRLNYTLGGTSPDYTISAGIVTAKSSNKTVPGA